MKILLIDDCEEIGFLVNTCLKPYEVVQAYSILAAEDYLGREKFDLLLIDVSLPDGDGFKFCSQLAENPRWRNIPKIMLTAKGETADKVFGLNCGAEDYITKPFAYTEFRARVDVRLKSRLLALPGPLRAYGFEFDSDFQKCWRIDGPGRIDLQLTPTEYRLLLALARKEGIPMTRDELVDFVWKSHGLNIETRGIDAHITHLRKKMGPKAHLIVSVYGKGYALAEA